MPSAFSVAPTKLGADTLGLLGTELAGGVVGGVDTGGVGAVLIGVGTGLVDGAVGVVPVLGVVALGMGLGVLAVVVDPPSDEQALKASAQAHVRAIFCI